jgi:hypothetical protein
MDRGIPSHQIGSHQDLDSGSRPASRHDGQRRDRQDQSRRKRALPVTCPSPPPPEEDEMTGPNCAIGAISSGHARSSQSLSFSTNHRLRIHFHRPLGDDLRQGVQPRSRGHLRNRGVRSGSRLAASATAAPSNRLMRAGFAEKSFRTKGAPPQRIASERACLPLRRGRTPAVRSTPSKCFISKIA